MGQNKRKRGGWPMLEPYTAGRSEGPLVADLSVDSFLSPCLLLDLEVGRDQKIYHMGALLGDKALERKGPMGLGILKGDVGAETTYQLQVNLCAACRNGY